MFNIFFHPVHSMHNPTLFFFFNLYISISIFTHYPTPSWNTAITSLSVLFIHDIAWECFILLAERVKSIIVILNLQVGNWGTWRIRPTRTSLGCLGGWVPRWKIQTVWFFPSATEPRLVLISVAMVIITLPLNDRCFKTGKEYTVPTS